MIKLHVLLPLLFVLASFIPAPPPQKTQNFWARLKSFFGVSANPGNQKGGEPEADGDIFLYNVTTKFGSQLKQGTFRSPIFMADDKAILALSGNKVVKIEVDNGKLTELFTVPGIIKLVGAEKDAPNQVLILSDLDNDRCFGVGVLSLTDGKVTTLDYGSGQEDRDMVSHLRGWTREYDNGDTKLQIQANTKKVNDSDVTTTDAFLKLKDKQDSINISRCPTGVFCGQPSISNDRKFVVFIGKV
jgi:hypothetical protein